MITRKLEEVEGRKLKVERTSKSNRDFRAESRTLKVQRTYKIQPRLQTFGLAACAGGRKRASDDRKLKVQGSKFKADTERRFRSGLGLQPLKPWLAIYRFDSKSNITAKEKAIFSYLPQRQNEKVL